ncbi:MAG: hypothetical protein ABJA62_00485 [Luteimonas sp.]
MNESNGYAVFFFPQALESLGEAIKPYLQDSPAGQHVLCNAIDTGGALIEMTLFGNTPDNRRTALQLMVPSGMVRMIVSKHSDEMFGFGPYAFERNAQAQPPVGPTAAPASAPSEALPHTAEKADAPSAV